MSNKKSRNSLLFTPGPVAVNGAVLKKLSEPILFHRTGQLLDIHKRISNKLLKFFGANSRYIPLLITGSGTLSNETALSSLVAKREKLLILSNGLFGERLAEIAKLHELNYKILEFDWATNIDIEKVKHELRNYKPRFVALVALETSTGMANPVREVGRLCKKCRAIFFVDGVSAIGGQNIKISRDNIDVCTSVPNKALEAPPGLSFICIRRTLLEKKLPKPTSYYMDISRYYAYLKKYQVPTTPSVSAMVALDKALDLFLDEALDNRIRRYKVLSKLVGKKAADLGIRFLLDERVRANGISTFHLPNTEYAERLNNYLLRKGYTVWHHKYQKSDKRLWAIMQISIMGNIAKRDINNLFKEVKTFTSKYPLNY